MSNKQRSALNYRDAGVDIEAGDALVDKIKPIARSTLRDGCLSGLGGFGALFEVPKRYRDPILVSGTDGVGTKLKLAFELDQHHAVGIDLVAMCANDVLAQGAEPLFFLDYFATGRLAQETAVKVIEGIGEGCRQAGAALIGGETAEMPGMYAGGEYDLAGFCVGVVERNQILTGDQVRIGDLIIGLQSSGLHANGFSLVRKVLDVYPANLDTSLPDGNSLGTHLLAPTRIYVKPVLELLRQTPVHAIAHITGGGLPGNIRRVLPAATVARIDTTTWARPLVYHWLEETAGIDQAEMYRTFNCGVGMSLIVPATAADAAVDLLARLGQPATIIGAVEPGAAGPEVVMS